MTRLLRILVSLVLGPILLAALVGVCLGFICLLAVPTLLACKLGWKDSFCDMPAVVQGYVMFIVVGLLGSSSIGAHHYLLKLQDWWSFKKRFPDD